MSKWLFLVNAARASWQAHGAPERVMAAVSGGADSMLLLRVLLELSRKEKMTLSAVHVDHGLRPVSGQDAQFVAESCAAWNIPLFLRSVALRGSGEEEARAARYQAIADCAVGARAEAVALAHHQQDQAETVLLHLFRGSGARGLAGMRPWAALPFAQGAPPFAWRPLLDIPREALRKAAEEITLSWREDETNAQSTYLRNYLRHAVFPAVRGRLPQAEAAICRTAKILAAEDDCLQAQAQDFARRFAVLAPPCRYMDFRAFTGLHPALQRRALRLALPEESDFALIERIRALRPGESENLPQGGRLLVTERYLHFLPAVSEAPSAGKTEIVPCPAGETGDGVRRQAFPAGTLRDCALRFRQPGDCIRPLGGPGDKSLQDYFTDRKVPRPFRDYVPLLCRGKRVLWAVGVGPGEEARTAPGVPAEMAVYTGFLPGEFPPL